MSDVSCAVLMPLAAQKASGITGILIIYRRSLLCIMYTVYM